MYLFLPGNQFRLTIFLDLNQVTCQILLHFGIFWDGNMFGWNTGRQIWHLDLHRMLMSLVSSEIHYTDWNKFYWWRNSEGWPCFSFISYILNWRQNAHKFDIFQICGQILVSLFYHLKLTIFPYLNDIHKMQTSCRMSPLSSLKMVIYRLTENVFTLNWEYISLVI